MASKYKVIGVMSGTSLDGVDIAFCHFENKDNRWNFKIIKAQTVYYNTQWKQRLENLSKLDALTFVKTDIDYGIYLGDIIKKFIEVEKIKPEFIASHGHTIFHRSNQSTAGSRLLVVSNNLISAQIGNGAYIAATCTLPVICDFRSMDIALGGQGAPLVAIGDKLLFSEYELCLNLGGIANISFRGASFDICPMNIVLNYFANQLDVPFDKDGKIAMSGKYNAELFKKLNQLKYYKSKYPKSIGKEWIDGNILPILESSGISIKDKLNTFCHHIAYQITSVIKSKNNHNKQCRLLITGGGTYNDFLMSCLETNLQGNIQHPASNIQLIIPDKQLIEYKEALIFAFLGVLRMRNEENCLKSVTGAKRNSVGGAIYQAEKRF
ncbi:MAG: anhydro-N-acetylmuramic acid kinase [Cytophagales bacterium]|nr:anhydro-N-acetylmuramic acid kinase [Cytophagales bacterium]